MKKFFKNFYLLLIFLFLYAPIVVLMIFSFNDSKSRRLWNGFTTRWYVELFRDADILHSLYVTLLVAVAAAAIATMLGTIAAIGIHNMGRRAKAAYLTVNNIPMSSSDTIMGVTFMLLFAAIGLDKGYLTLILAHVTFCTPYVVLNVMPKLRQLDKKQNGRDGVDLWCHAVTGHRVDHDRQRLAGRAGGKVGHHKIVD